MSKYKSVISVIFCIICVLLLTRQPVRAFDLTEAINTIKNALFQREYLQELETGEFLLKAEHGKFQVYFGDREKQGHHRVKIAKENLGFEFSFEEATISTSESLPAIPESSPFASRDAPGVTTDKTATPSSALTEDLSEDQKEILEKWQKELEEIQQEQASMAAKLEKAKQEVESIDKVINQTVPGTDIGFDELEKNQLVVKNSQVEPGVDIYYWKRENDLREKVIFRKSPAPSKLVFSLDSQGLTPFDIGAGVIYFYDQEGHSVFRITKGYIKDLTNAFSNEVMTYVKDNQLVHTLDPEWVNAPERVYPLTLYFDFQLLSDASIASVTPSGASLTPKATTSTGLNPFLRPDLIPISTQQTEEAQPKIVGELKKERTLHSKTFLKEDASYHAKIHIGPIHYQEEDGQLEEINTEFVPSSQPEYDYEVTRGLYKARLKKNFDAEDLAGYRFQDLVTSLQFLKLNWVGENNQKELISSPQSVTATPESNRLRYPAAYGPGLDVEFLYHPTYFGKYLVIQNLESLPPSSFNAHFLEFNFKMTLSENLEVFVNGQPLNEGPALSTQEKVEFKDKKTGQRQFYFKKPYSVDAQGNKSPITLSLQKQGSTLLIAKQIDKNWLEKANFPIKADADTINLEADAWDMYDEVGVGNQINSDTVLVGRMGSYFDGYWAFPISGTIISSATNSVTFTGHISSNDTTSATEIFGLEQQNCPDLEANDPSGYTPTTASYSWTLTDSQTGSQTSGDMQGPFDEWITDTSPTDGHRFGMVIDSSSQGNNKEIYFYDSTHASYSSSTYLIIDYTSSNQPPTAPSNLLTNETASGAQTCCSNPSAVGDSTPVFSARYNDPDTSDTADYYQLIVYSENTCTTEVWDSGQQSMTNCDQGNHCLTVTNHGIEYGGTALRFDGSQYWWKIKYWDVAAAEGAYSNCSAGNDYFYILNPTEQMRHGNYHFNRTTKRMFTW